MADEKNMMPELTLTPDTTAAAEEVPTLTLEPTAPAAPAVPEPEKKREGIGFWGVVGAVIVALLILSFL